MLLSGPDCLSNLLKNPSYVEYLGGFRPSEPGETARLKRGESVSADQQADSSPSTPADVMTPDSEESSSLTNTKYQSLSTAIRTNRRRRGVAHRNGTLKSSLDGPVVIDHTERT